LLNAAPHSTHFTSIQSPHNQYFLQCFLGPKNTNHQPKLRTHRQPVKSLAISQPTLWGGEPPTNHNALQSSKKVFWLKIVKISARPSSSAEKRNKPLGQIKIKINQKRQQTRS